jgi:MFS transporter, Spinster family, sphingosine-1-phosphate transporter
MRPNSSANAGRATPLPGARAALVLLLAINLFNYIDRYVLASTLPYISDEPDFLSANSWAAGFLRWFQTAFGFEPKMALLGLLSTAFMVTYMAAAPVFSRLSERYSRWVLVGVGVLLWSLASCGSGLAATFGLLLLTRCFVGIGEAAYGPIAPTVLSDFYPVKIRGRVLSWFYLALPVGTALGYIFGENVAKSHLGWRWAFFLVLPPGLLLGMWSFFMRDPPRGAADEIQPRVSGTVNWRDYLQVLKTPSYILCTLGMTAMTFAMGGIATWMPYYLSKLGPVAGLTNNPVSLFGGLTCVAGFIATLTGGIVGDKLRARCSGSYFLVSAMAMLAGLPLFVAFFFAPFPLAWMCLFLACFCLFFNTGPTNTILANVTHPAIRASAFALNILVIHSLGDVLSPLVIGLLSDRFGMRIAFLSMGIMFILSAGFWLAGMKHLASDTQAAVHPVPESTMNASLPVSTSGPQSKRSP